jgi:hypothetical protein
MVAYRIGWIVDFEKVKNLYQVQLPHNIKYFEI